jgi:predicted GNAT family N-acyltransferase
VENYLQAEKTAQVWAEIADSVYEALDVDHPLAEKFAASSAVTKHIKTRLKKPEISHLFYECEDSNNEKQGLMILDIKNDDSKLLELSYLATHPRNIDGASVEAATGNKQLARVKGVGTSLLKIALVYALNQKYDITLSAYNSAKGFYLKYGFKEISSNQFCTKMILEVDKIQEVVSSIDSGI